MELLQEFGPTKYKPYVQLLEDELVMLEKDHGQMAKTIEEINKERKYAQVRIFCCCST